MKRILFVGHAMVFVRVLTCYETKKGVYFLDYNRQRTYLKPKGSVGLPPWVSGNSYEQDYEYDIAEG